jgi:hypothetical protein
MFAKLLVYFYTMIELPINCILMGLITYFMFEVQINYMWSLKKFKVTEILCVTTFILYVIPIFPKIVYIVMCFHLSFNLCSTWWNHYKSFYLCYFFNLLFKHKICWFLFIFTMNFGLTCLISYMKTIVNSFWCQHKYWL